MLYHSGGRRNLDLKFSTRQRACWSPGSTTIDGLNLKRRLGKECLSISFIKDFSLASIIHIPSAAENLSECLASDTTNRSYEAGPGGQRSPREHPHILKSQSSIWLSVAKMRKSWISPNPERDDTKQKTTVSEERWQKSSQKRDAALEMVTPSPETAAITNNTSESSSTYLNR